MALNIADFDITDQVAQQLNKILPAVTIPPDGVEPLAQGQDVVPPIVPAAAARADPLRLRPTPAAPAAAPAKKP